MNLFLIVIARSEATWRSITFPPEYQTARQARDPESLDTARGPESLDTARGPEPFRDAQDPEPAKGWSNGYFERSGSQRPARLGLRSRAEKAIRTLPKHAALAGLAGATPFLCFRPA